MTSELLEMLYLEIRTKDAGNANESKNSATGLSKVCWLVIYQIYFLLPLAC